MKNEPSPFQVAYCYEEYFFVEQFPDFLFDSPTDVCTDSSGNIYIADCFGCCIHKFDQDGNFLMKWGSVGSGNGQFRYSVGIAVDSSGCIYVADWINHRIQKFDSNGNFLMKWGTQGTGDGQFNGPHNLEIDAYDNIFVADINNHRIQKFDSNGNFLMKWGTHGTGDGQFYQPFGIAIDIYGNIYIADYGNNRIQKFDPSGTFLLKWGTLGTGDGQFRSPYGVTIDSYGNIYVSDHSNHRIQKFDSTGNFLMKWGTAGTGNGQFHFPSGIEIDKLNEIYTAESANRRIQKFDLNGNFLSSIEGDMDSPYDIAFDNSGDIYITDRRIGGPNEEFHCCIKKYSTEGKLMGKWGTIGTADGQFLEPNGIAIDSSGNIYICDDSKHNVQKFDSDGKFLMKWGSFGGYGAGYFNSPADLACDTLGNVYVVDVDTFFSVQKFDSNGNFLTWFTTILPLCWGSLAIDDSGNVYIGGNHIEKFGPDREFLIKIGDSGTGIGQFQGIRGMDTDSSGNIYVADSFNNRIQKFDPNGNLLAVWGSSGSGYGHFKSPKGIAVDDYGNVYVVDSGNRLIQKFSPSNKSTPSAPVVSSPTHAENEWIISNDPTFNWTTPHDISDIDGYSYILDHSPSTIPDTTSEGTDTTKSYTDLADAGDWYFHCRARDGSGNWRDTGHYGPVKIDTTPPSAPAVSSLTHTEGIPSSNNDPIFNWTKPDDLSGIYGYSYMLDKSSSTIPDEASEGSETTKSYKDLAEGTYYFHCRARDNAGNWGETDHYGPVMITACSVPNLYAVEYKYDTRQGNGKGYIFDWRNMHFRSWLKVRIENPGTCDVSGVKAFINNNKPVNVAIIDGEVSCGNIAAGSSVWSQDSFCLEVDLSNLQNSDKGIYWDIGYYVSGKYYEVKDVPEFPKSAAPSLNGSLALQNRLWYIKPAFTKLHANYPNPFNPETWIPFELSSSSAVKVSIYDIQGRLVRVLDLGYRVMGEYFTKSCAAHWDGRNESGEPVPSGVYFYQLSAGDYNSVRKMVIVK